MDVNAEIRKTQEERQEMENDLSTLPPEIILHILLRIPVKTVFTCKCVCKAWLELLETPEFTRSHLSNSVPRLLIHHVDTNCVHSDVFKIFELEDSQRHKTVLELKCDNVFGRSCKRMFGPSCKQRKFGRRCEGVFGLKAMRSPIGSSTDGLLFFRNTHPYLNAYYICNPTTREYMRLPKPQRVDQYPDTIVPCGFGASRLSNRYKVVRIFDDIISYNDGRLLVRQSFAQVYTLGTESWSDSTTPCKMLLNFSYSDIGKLLNGNLHWLARDPGGSWWISCFDLETEALTEFRGPVLESGVYKLNLGVLADRLCLCDNTSEREIVIHLMSDYGDEEKSWNKEYVISNVPVCVGWSCEVGAVYVVKAFANGDLLLARDNSFLFYFSKGTSFLFYYSKGTNTINMFDLGDIGKFEALPYSPSLISLKNFETENVKLL